MAQQWKPGNDPQSASMEADALPLGQQGCNSVGSMSTSNYTDNNNANDLLISGARGQYVDVLNPGGGGSSSSKAPAVPADLFNVLPSADSSNGSSSGSKPQLFNPSGGELACMSSVKLSVR